MNLSPIRLCAVIGLSIGALALPTTAFAGGGGGGGGCYGGGKGTSVNFVAGPVPADATASSAAPGTVFAGRFSGQNADAAWSTVSGSIETDVSVDASDQSAQQVGSGSIQSGMVFVAITKTDLSACVQTEAAFGFASVPESAYTINPGLRSATLTTSIPMVDYISGNSGNVSLGLTWTGTGDIYRESGRFTYHSGGFIATKWFDGMRRGATVSGILSDGTTNYADAAPTYADLSFDRSGYMVISHLHFAILKENDGFKEVMMATAKQKAAARKNIKKAQAAAKKKRTIAHLPKKTRTALGKQANKIKRQKAKKKS